MFVMSAVKHLVLTGNAHFCYRYLLYWIIIYKVDTFSTYISYTPS